MNSLPHKIVLSLLATLFTFSFVFAQKVHLETQKNSVQQVDDSRKYQRPLLTPRENLPLPDASKSLMTLDPPDNIKVNVEGTSHIHLTWDIPASSPGSQFIVLFDDDGDLSNGYHIYQAVGSGTYAGIHRIFHNTGLDIGETFNIYMQSNTPGTSIYSPFTLVGTYKYEWKTLGAGVNQMNITYENWSPSEESDLSDFVDKMVPIINDNYGYPSRRIDMVIRQDNSFGAFYENIDNVVSIPGNSIFVQRNWSLLTHELIHAWRDNVILASNSDWYFDPLNSGFEEGFAEALANECMNQYVLENSSDFDLSGNPAIPNNTFIFNSLTEWNYDIQNQTAISTGDYRTSTVFNRGLTNTRYQMGAAAIKKIQIENNDFYKKFNEAYYTKLNANQTTPVTRTMITTIIEDLVPSIEGQPAIQWLDKQKIFDCAITPGEKIFNLTFSSFGSSYYSENRYFYYNTTALGNDIALNGTMGSGGIYDNLGTLKKAFDPEITGVPGSFGQFSVLLLNNPMDILGADYLYWGENVTLGLYRIDMTFGTITNTDYRVAGTQLNGADGIFGGVINGNGGVIFIDHESFSPEVGMLIENGAFQGTRSWVNNANPNTGGFDSEPGRLTIRYIDNSFNEYLTYRNIDLGNEKGLQQFLFDVDEMTLVDNCSVPPITGFELLTSCNGNAAISTKTYSGVSHQFRFRKSGNVNWTTTAATTAQALKIGVLNECTAYEIQMRIYCTDAKRWSKWSKTKVEHTRPHRINYNGVKPDPHDTYAHLASHYHNGDLKQFRVWGPGLATTYKTTVNDHVSLYHLKPKTTYSYQIRRQCGTTGTWSCFSKVFDVTTIQGRNLNSGSTTKAQAPIADGAVHLYPNPVNGDLLNVRISDPETTIESIELISIDGQVLFNQVFNDQTLIQLPVNELPKGIYLVRVNGQVTQRFVRM